MNPPVFTPQAVLAQSVALAGDINTAIPIVLAELAPLTTPAIYAQGQNYAAQLMMLDAEWIDMVAPMIAQLLG